MTHSQLPPITFNYYFCPDPTDPNEQIEVQEMLKQSTHCFIFIPLKANFDNIAIQIQQGTCYGCVWGVKKESDSEKVIDLYKKGTLSTKTWGEIGAKRICFTPAGYIEDEDTVKAYDWITDEWMQAGATPVS